MTLRSLAACSFILGAAACGGAPAHTTTTGNTAAGAAWAPTMALTAADVPGVLGYGPFKHVDDAGFMPVSQSTDVVVPADAAVELSPGAPYLLLGSSGAPIGGVATAPYTITHGCDGGDLGVVGITPSGGAAVPGLTWAIPTPLPNGWAPSVLPLETTGPTPAQQVWQVGPLTVTSATTGATTGAITVAAGDQTLGTIPYERGTMDEDPEARINLTETFTPGVDTLVAAWQVAPGGPIVLGLFGNGFEGGGPSAYLVGATSIEPIERMDAGIYYCAY